MTSTADRYEAANRPLVAVLDAVPADAWAAPSPCAGWTARDVLTHMTETQREFLTGRGVELGPAPDLAADPAAGWRAHAEQVSRVLADEGVVSAGYDGHFGPTTVGATLEQFYVWDMVVHRWDIARTAGIDPQLTSDELDRMESGADSFGPALYMDGVCGQPVEVPEDAPREVRVLARMGRAG